MSFKPVEMQIAIPRTQDASHAQQQLQHKPVTDQHLLAERSTRQADRKLRRPNQVDAASHARIEEEPSDARQGGNKRRRSSAAGEAEDTAQSPSAQMQQAQHPFKGRHIDFSL